VLTILDVDQVPGLFEEVEEDLVEREAEQVWDEV
jgi:hypothetical protein